MVYGLVIIKALRDKYAIQMKEKGTGKKQWHALGFLLLFWATFWGLWAVRPIEVRTISVGLILASTGWILFDVALNLFRGLEWNHIGDSEVEKKLENKIFFAKFVTLLFSLILFFISV